jgi:hypothetical protein
VQVAVRADNRQQTTKNKHQRTENSKPCVASHGHQRVVLPLCR